MTIKRKNGMRAALAAGTLIALGVGATDTVTVTAESADVALDTRSLSRVTALEEDDLDTRSYTVDWSEARTLNTKKIMGTLLLMR